VAESDVLRVFDSAFHAYHFLRSVPRFSVRRVGSGNRTLGHAEQCFGKFEMVQAKADT
jgi:hypothetical protein